MRIIKMGVDPDLKLTEKYTTWTAHAKHWRCGTKVELNIADVFFQRYPGGWDEGPYISAHWMCPVCTRDQMVSISRWKLDNELRDYWWEAIQDKED